MIRTIRSGLALCAGLAAAFFATAALAAACCNVSRTHQVRVPSVVVSQPTGGCGSSCAPKPCDECAPKCEEDCGGRKHRNRDRDRDRERNRFSGSFEFNVDVTSNANANAAANSLVNSNVFANSVAFGLSGAINGSASVGGSSGSGFFVGTSSSYIPNLMVESAAAASVVTVPYQATRTIVKTVVIHAVCIDDKLIPHPASQVRPDKEVAESYDGELYRCLAGTRMQYTVAEHKGLMSVEGGQSQSCAKNQALYHVAGGRLECRPQKAARNCNERSLLRRYGAGMKIVRLAMTETYTAYRTETVAASASASAEAVSMALDGGVGGVVF